ncbi:gamma-glutamyltransferase family protein [Salipaludibacillus sp. CF4.18]|uniref:gamma-glutamyltransferase family protein n=1 Tax=Salipaludibacillus sp. CF4.18 TaxID=3373081 RepID=UPI003EE5DF7E
MNYKKYLVGTHVLAVIIFVGLIAWNFYFEDEFDQFREPYSGSDFQERQVDSVDVNQGASSNQSPAEETSDNDQAPSRPGIYGVSSIHPLAAEAGMKVIENGGNAADAAVAVSFMLNVVEPYGSGIGGGGLMLVHDPEDGAVTYDYREAAPESGAQSPPNGRVAIPGLVKGMEKLHQEMGSGNEEASWEKLLQPAIDAAENGFEVGAVLQEQIANSTRYIQIEDSTTRQLYYPDGQPLQVNDILVQEELGETLTLIQENGASGFYEGEVAQGLGYFGFTSEDLAGYEAKTTETVSAEIGDQIVHGGPSPSSGTVVVQALQIANQLDLEKVLTADEIADLRTKLAEDGITDREPQVGDLMNYEEYEHNYIHLMTEITDTAYSSRLDTLGDPYYDNIDHSDFTSPETIDRFLEGIYSGNSETSSGITDEMFDSPGEEKDARNTTHFVIIDKEGRMVSATNSLGQFFGSGFYTNGFFVNSQMDNFSGNPESPNYYEPGKRPRSFVSPMIFEEKGQAVLGIGSPGGRRIPAMVFQTIMKYQHGLDDDNNKLTLQDAIEMPRFYTEDGVVNVESDLEDDVNNNLQEMGYTVYGHSSPLYYGGIQGLGTVLDEDGNLQSMYGGGDPRRKGAWQIETGE